MSNGRFAISVHILTLLASEPEQYCSSEYLSGSININPVLVRKELVNLRNHGLVISKEGKTGGSTLAKSAGLIAMSDIYDAVREKQFLGKSINEPNPACTIGRQINQHLDDLYRESERALMQSLDKMTLAEFLQKFS
ncbi:RrF2 family transcriptional regulator [Dyadobacter frigoris]|uniref:Rrf2 family transcriptional regulator n=1 Tax=Dyadobacter frigoris TaxID=2576211 RepID=A0A4U6CSE7_9BACT|nr:Rrf2 family transcriptional regulator [Dyadobacter frigoris]TKT87512.1 Rrf2 family transcriptional regulator [Dyadobacter frigoris]GLU52233.1 Rrf2 family transcriptional regulator [Dyadobacter frigoris]